MVLRVTTLVANPAPASRTLAAGEAATRALMDHFALPDADLQTLDFACDSLGMFDASSASIGRLMQRVADSRHVVVIASPVYKATFTALLKAFSTDSNPIRLCAMHRHYGDGRCDRTARADDRHRAATADGQDGHERSYPGSLCSSRRYSATTDAWSIVNLPLVARLLPPDR